MRKQGVWLVAVGMGLMAAAFLVLSGPGAGRAGASPSQLCIGANEVFVTCGQPGQGSVLPSPPASTGGPASPTTAAPTKAAPTRTQAAPLRVASRAGAVRLTHGEDATVVVVGTLAAIVLLAELIVVTVLRPGDRLGAGGSARDLRFGPARPRSDRRT